MPDASSQEPITPDEWRHMHAVIREAVERATDSGGMVHAIPNISVWRGEMGANRYRIQRWKDEKLKWDEPRSGASAHPDMLTVYNYTGKFVGGLTPHARDDVTRRPGPWHAEVRRMVAEIEAWTGRQPPGRGPRATPS